MGWEQFLDTVGAVLLVLCLLFAVRWVLLRTGVATTAPRGRRIEVIESAMLGAKNRVHLIDVEGQRLLIGSGEQGVCLLRDQGPVSEQASADEAPPLPGSAHALRRTVLHGVVFLAVLFSSPIAALADPGAAPASLTVSVPDGISLDDRSSALDMLGLLTIIAVAPSILLMGTCFTRFVIVLAFVRQAIGVQHMPPNQVLVGLALFLTAFVMAPIGEEVSTRAYDPYVAGELSAQEAFAEAVSPVRQFMLGQTREEDLALFVDLSGGGAVVDPEEVSLTTLLPSFLISELRTAFEIGFVIFLPFLIIDLVVASLLISMGMIVLPPIVVSLPFKIMLFVLVDGWNLILGSLVRGLV